MHSTAFGEEEDRMRRSFYFNERPYLGDASIWYSDDVVLLDTSSRRAGVPIDTVRPVGWGDAAPYWTPRQDLHEHMRTVAAASKNRLVRPTPQNGKKVNPAFRTFPVKYALADSTLGEFEIDDTIRIRSVHSGVMEIERANYLDQLATNIQSDLAPPGWPKTLRESEIDNGRLKPFAAQSCFANTIGSCAVLIDKDAVPVLRYRGRPDATLSNENGLGRRMAVMEKGWHCAASGVTTWQDLLWGEPERTECTFLWLLRGVTAGMWRELDEETGLNEADGLRMTALAFVRELKRAGKPNFIFVIEAKDRTCADLERLMLERNPRDKDEYRASKKEGRSLFGIIRESKPVSFMIDTDLRLDRLADVGFRGPTTGFTYENYAALRFAAQWWMQRNKTAGRADAR